MPIVRRIARESEKWFRKHQRALPWRATYEPYRVWVSEVMLQQTQMPVVLRYYDRFLERFPTIADLAAASIDDVTAAWSGLGYYRRARMLREAAITIGDRFGGALPDDVASLMTIPGIGRYTAGAIASIAYNRSAPIVDGNISRILARLFGSGDAWKQATDLVAASRSPRMFNQALMEIGALICRPRNPLCDRCPLRSECRAFARGRTELQPRKRANTRALRIPLYVITDRRGRILMRRESGALFDGMFVLPEKIAHSPRKLLGQFRHTITNRRITFTVWRAAVSAAVVGRPNRRPKVRWIRPEELAAIPHPSYVGKALRLAGIV